jgi:hypothetical protein
MLEMSYKLLVDDRIAPCQITSSRKAINNGIHLLPLEITSLKNINFDDLAVDRRTTDCPPPKQERRGHEFSNNQQLQTQADEKSPLNHIDLSKILTTNTKTSPHADDWILESIILNYHYLTFSFCKLGNPKERLIVYLDNLKDIEIGLRESASTNTPVKKYIIDSFEHHTPAPQVRYDPNFIPRSGAPPVTLPPDPVFPKYNPRVTEYQLDTKIRTAYVTKDLCANANTWIVIVDCQ